MLKFLKKKAFTIAFLFSFFPILYTYAQNFEEGYIVRNNSDTLKGYIEYFSWEINPTSIQFKTSLNSNPSLFSIKDVLSFHINTNGETYTAYKITIVHIREFIGTDTSPIQGTETIEVFLRKLVGGKSASLYEMTDSKLRKRYFFEKNNILTELINYEYDIYNNDGHYRRKVNQYVNQLATNFSDCNLTNNITPEYKQKYLISYFIRYNACFGQIQPESVVKPDKIKVRFGIAGGGISFPESNYIQGGISVKYIIPRKNNNRYLLTELSRIFVDNLPAYSTSLLYGRYIGKKDHSIKMFVNGGVSSLFNPQDLSRVDNSLNFIGSLGVGVAVKKRLHLEFRNNVIVLPINIWYGQALLRYYFGKQ